MSYKYVSTKHLKLTKRLADEFQAVADWDGNRNFNQTRYANHERALRSGLWRSCQWAKAICRENNIEYRVNGNHTSRLFSNLADEFPGYFVDIEHFECDTKEDVGVLWGTFDPKTSARHVGDINSAIAKSNPLIAELPKSIIDTAVSGVALAKCEGSTGTKGKTSAIEWAKLVLIDNGGFVFWLSELLNNGEKARRHILRSGVVAGIYVTYQKCKRDAEIFWKDVRDETGESPNKPSRQLLRFLLMTSSRGAGRNCKPTSGVVADSREFFAKSVHCWNAFRRNEQLKTIKYFPQAKVPTAI